MYCLLSYSTSNHKKMGRKRRKKGKKAIEIERVRRGEGGRLKRERQRQNYLRVKSELRVENLASLEVGARCICRHAGSGKQESTNQQQEARRRVQIRAGSGLDMGCQVLCQPNMSREGPGLDTPV